MTERVYGFQKPRPHEQTILGVDAEQDQARNGLASTKDKLAEIFVSREEKTPFPDRQRHYLHVAQTGREFGDVEHIVTSATQLSNQRDCDALVCEPEHGSTIDDIFVGQIIGRKSLGCPDIVRRKPRVL